MNITQQPTLSQWVSAALVRQNGVGKYIETVYHSPRGTVECYTEIGHEGQHPATRLRMVINGIGWECTAPQFTEPDRLLRMASAFANVAWEAAGAQHQFVSDGAGLATVALEFARVQQQEASQ